MPVLGSVNYNKEFGLPQCIAYSRHFARTLGFFWVIDCVQGTPQAYGIKGIDLNHWPMM